MSTEISTPHAYASLTPDVVLDALATVGLIGDGRLLSLNSYENRVYMVYLDTPFIDGSGKSHAQVVTKFYRPDRWTELQIREELSFADELVADEVPLIAALNIVGDTLHHFAPFWFTVSARCGGRAPELESPQVLQRIGRFMGRLHSVGRRSAFLHRPALNVQTFGIESRDFLMQSGLVPAELTASWQAIVDQAIEACLQSFERVGEVAQIRLHGDCHPGNILWSAVSSDGFSGNPFFVDLDDARSGPAVQDLWMLLSGDETSMKHQLREVLTGYEDFCEFDDAQVKLIEPLRTLRLIHYSAWIARRWDDPAFPVAFPWFNTQRYWQDRILELREQVGLMGTM